MAGILGNILNKMGHGITDPEIKEVEKAFENAKTMGNASEGSFEEAVRLINLGIKIEKAKVRRAQIREMRIGRKVSGKERNLNDAINASINSIRDINKQVSHGLVLTTAAQALKTKADEELFAARLHAEGSLIAKNMNQVDEDFNEVLEDLNALKSLESAEVAIDGVEEKYEEDVKKQIDEAKKALAYAKQQFELFFANERRDE